MTSADDLSCPLPIDGHETVQLGHGGGGRMTSRLIDGIFLQAFDDPELARRHDGAVLPREEGRLAFTTDSYVVRPLFFPGGDIGCMAVYGTVNDLAMCGARPRYISAGFILEEGFPLADLRRIAESMRRAAARAGVRIVTGDTKVVDRGRGDGVYINTAGVGRIECDLDIGPASIRPGDRILLSGDIGRHGMAIMACREGLEFETTLESDCAPVHAQVLALLEAGIPVHCLRDLTRGGLATALLEIAASSALRIDLEESAIPVDRRVLGACELLGLDPLYVANEGRFVALVSPEAGDAALALLQGFDPQAACIGSVAAAPAGEVVLRSVLGAHRVLDLLSGEQLPRIC
jgi:hydrogenase expression/formation protein HypE